MTYVRLVNSGHTLASLRFSFSSFSWSWPPSAPLLVSMLCSCGLLCCSASGCFRPSSAATLDCFTSVMLKDKIHIRGRSQNKHVSWQIIHFCYFWIKAYAPKNQWQNDDHRNTSREMFCLFGLSVLDSNFSVSSGNNKAINISESFNNEKKKQALPALGSLAVVSRVPASRALTRQMGNPCSISWKCAGKPKLSIPARTGSPPGYIWITEP